MTKIMQIAGWIIIGAVVVVFALFVSKRARGWLSKSRDKRAVVREVKKGMNKMSHDEVVYLLANVDMKRILGN